MTTHLQPWHFAFVWSAGWVNRKQYLVIDYLCKENRVLREQVGKKRILLTDDQRRRLTEKGKGLGRNDLESIITQVANRRLLEARSPDVLFQASKSPKNILGKPEPSGTPGVYSGGSEGATPRPSVRNSRTTSMLVRPNLPALMTLAAMAVVTPGLAGFAPPTGIYALGAAQDDPLTVADERLQGIRDYDFVSGFTLRALWRDIETAPGVYDFSFIGEAMQRVGAIGQRLNLELLDVPPQHVVSAASTTYIDHRGESRPVPWDPATQAAQAAMRNALASYVVDDGAGLTLNQHPLLASVDASPAGLNFGVRDLNNGLRSHPDYTAERYVDAVVEGTVVTQATFPDHLGFLAFFGFDDGVADPPVDQQLIAELAMRFNGVDQPRLAFFAENLSDIGPTAAGPGVGVNLLSWANLGGPTMMQALDSWQRHRSDRDPQLTSLNPATGIELAFEGFGTRFVELYIADLDAAVEGALDADGRSLIDDLRSWNAILTGSGIPGDFNNDSVVDAADYTVWRDGLGTTFAQSDFDVWVNNFGATTTATLMFTGVPEPSTGLLTHIAFFAPWRPRRW